ncbi:MAG: hotdog fold thioesterase [Gammaproteobacteria bacterium]|nr:hotdog fold thioesterase [Gammaproteobacteria bacterium]
MAADHTDSFWRPGITLEHVRARLRHTAAEHLGIELVDMGAEHVAATMPVDHRTCQPMRMLHGGASVLLAETIGSVAANAANHDPSRHFVGQEINANHLRPVPEGSVVTGVASPVHIGRSSQVWNIEIRNERGQLVCVSRLTMAAIAAPRE